MIDKKNQKAMVNRLARIEGQLRGISKLVEADEPDCEKVIQQMAASRKALDKAAHVMLACMIEHAVATETTGDQEELSKLISKYA